jgi:hypothetical protein
MLAAMAAMAKAKAGAAAAAAAAPKAATAGTPIPGQAPLGKAEHQGHTSNSKCISSIKYTRSSQMYVKYNMI